MNFSDSKDPMFKEENHSVAKRKALIYALVALVLGFTIGILIGRFATCPENKTEPKPDGTFLPGVPESIIQDGDPAISDEIINGIKAENIRQYLQELSENPHLAGTPADWQQADELRTFWKNNGLDEVFINEYEVLLSYPNTTDENNMNQIQIINGTGDIVYASPLYEDILDPSENKSNVVPPFNAYSAPGIVESEELVYVNYGRVEDYRYLDTLNINVSGKVVIARYGKIFRGDKANLASIHGAIGLIIYSDPKDYTDGQTDSSQVYPHNWFLPASGTQRGTIFLGKGDPLTPGYPAIESAYRLKESDPEAMLPTIPTHPIGYGIAEKILQEMTGNEVNMEDWKGAIPNITYRYGGKLKDSTWKVKMRISTANHKRKTYNVIGIIRGAIEPDRYVLLGNHRDAWVFGAIDPSSGTAVMKEVSRVMGNLVKNKKWRPRRSIIFCSWGAEEYGLIGSTEWVEQYVKNLAERSIAYLNVDIAVQGNFSLRALSTPLLYDVIFSAAKKVPHPSPEEGFSTVYDKYRASFPKEPNNPNTVPRLPADVGKLFYKTSLTVALNKQCPIYNRVVTMGSGSDFAPMIQMVGLPACDLSYKYNIYKYSNLSFYPLYHSKYETFLAVDQIIDKGFKHHQATGRVWAEMARHLSDTMILPLDVENFSTVLDGLVTTLDNDFGDLLRNHSIKFDNLRSVANLLKTETTAFTSMVKNVDRNNPLAVRHINDQLMLFERAFLDPQGLPGRPYARHVLFAESSVNTYAGSSFPGLADSLFEIESDKDQESRWKVVEKHFSVILFTIESAASTLRDVTKFIPDFVKS